jgi:hypothetical protein
MVTSKLVWLGIGHSFYLGAGSVRRCLRECLLCHWFGLASADL